MVKIRKKTSRRQPTRLRERIQHKVSESQKKAKKLAKKDPTWKSRKPKDPGVPALFPFKEQIVEEMKQAKLRKEAERLLKRQQRKIDATGTSVEQLALAVASRETETDISSTQEQTATPMTPSETSASLRTYARSLKAVLSRANVIIQVLDARDPLGTRSKMVEKEFLGLAGDKHLVLVLNKIDLVPRENVEAWLKYLRRSFPTLPFKSSTQSQRTNLGNTAAAAHASVSASMSTQPIMSLLKNYARSQIGGKAKSTITVGVVGMPNVGKSSFINSLKRSKACGVAPTPGFTKEVQEVALDAGIKILDCPGVVFEGGDRGPEHALRNALRIEQIEDPIALVEVLLQRCKPSQLMMLYNIPTFSNVQDFLMCVARARGRLKKGGLLDLPGTARSVLRDWNAGRIPYYTAAPALPASSSEQQASMPLAVPQEDAIVSSFAPEFDLDALFGEADQVAFSESTLAGDGKRLTVKMSLDEPNEAAQTRVKLLGETSDTPDSDMHDGLEIQGALVGTRKRTAGSENKQVRFADSSKRKSMEDDLEAPPISMAKKLKMDAKKAKKAARRANAGEASSMVLDEGDASHAIMSPPPESLSGLDVEASKLTVDDESEDIPDGTPYDFAAYFARSGEAADDDSDEWEDEEEL